MSVRSVVRILLPRNGLSTCQSIASDTYGRARPAAINLKIRFTCRLTQRTRKRKRHLAWGNDALLGGVSFEPLWLFADMYMCLWCRVAVRVAGAALVGGAADWRPGLGAVACDNYRVAIGAEPEGMTMNGRIMSLSSCSRMWQCRRRSAAQTRRPANRILL
jgi:hypothetical protein